MKKINLPTKITLARIALATLLIIGIIVLYFLDQFNVFSIAEVGNVALNDSGAYINWIMIILMLVFLIASMTDFLDGYLARKNNEVTDLGKFLDPIADKMLVNTMLILLVYTHQANIVAVLLMIARDLIVDGLRMLASQHGKVVSAGIYGKAKTVLQMFAILFLLLKNWPFVYLGLPMDQILLWFACLMSLLSGLIYFAQLKDFVLESM